MLQTNIERGKRGSKCLNKCVGWEWSILTISGAVWNTQLEHMYNFRQKANKDVDIKERGFLEH